MKETEIPEQEFNRKRSELLVPGSQLDLSEEEISHIPLLLIQQPGCLGECMGLITLNFTFGITAYVRCSLANVGCSLANFRCFSPCLLDILYNRRETSVGVGYGSGWDIILPSGWAMAFWMALVYHGARTGGLQEGKMLALEQGVPFFPNDFPGTPAGESYNAKLKDDGEAKYKRYQPAKRPNYDRLGVKSPFSPPWRELVKDWSSCKEVSSSAADGPTKSTSESTRTKIIASDSPQMVVSVVQPPHVLSTMKDKVGKISSDSRQHTQTNAIANCSSPMVGSVVQTLSVPDGTKEALTEILVIPLNLMPFQMSLLRWLVRWSRLSLCQMLRKMQPLKALVITLKLTLLQVNLLRGSVRWSSLFTSCDHDQNCLLYEALLHVANRGRQEVQNSARR